MSITKNLVAVAGFAAEAEGLLDLDEEVEGREGVTLRMLLDQTSGLEPGNVAIYGRRARDKTEATLGLGVVTKPGARFDYGPGNFELFGEVLRRKLAGRGVTPLEYVFAKVLRPIGATYADWVTDRTGTPYYSTGAKLTARDLAKFGEFVRTRGRAWIWPVIPEKEFDVSREGSAANSTYGLSFWLNRNARRVGAEPISVEGTLGEEWPPERWRRSSLSAVAPSDLIAMIGSGGIRCYVVPTEKLVIVRFGTGRGFSDAAFLAAIFGN
jgi:CubicO group peptidase (beta-lactamase class C family)